jgi:beta-fructofuranosidase
MAPLLQSTLQVSVWDDESRRFPLCRYYSVVEGASIVDENRVKEEALQALRDYNMAFEKQDIEGQVNFYSAAWSAGTGGREALKAHLHDMREKSALEVKHFALDDAEVFIDGEKATVEPVLLRAPSGGGLFTFKLQRESDGAFRCVQYVLIAEPDLDGQAARQLRERIVSDPARPGYHVIVPEGKAMPFDPNGAIYWKGRYHLFYIFQDMRSGEAADHWGHMSSVDLFHWRHHPTGLLDGMYSGNCFINKDGVPTICYHQKGEGNAIAVALDDDLNEWKKLDSNPITPKTEPSNEHHGKYKSWDPFGWLENDTYYAIFGGKRPGIAKSNTLEGPWTYVGDLFAHGVEGVALDEDVSCAELFKLGDKYVLLCISHRLGCRYYVGEWRDEQFYPESHAQMSWVDHTFFAPESLLDDQGRRIMWAWLMDEPAFGVRAPYGWSGTLSLPRVLSIGDDGLLRIDVPEEIERLRCRVYHMAALDLPADTEIAIDEASGDSLELLVEFESGSRGSYGLKVCVSDDGQEETRVFFDAQTNELKIDTNKSGPDDTPSVVEAGPLELLHGERLQLRVFVDKSVVEVFANSRQAIARRIYPSRRDSIGVRLFASGGDAQVHSLAAWQIAPANSS